MHRFFTLLLSASCLTAVGQVTYPYNPDGNADALIGATDQQGLLFLTTLALGLSCVRNIDCLGLLLPA